MLFSEDMDSIKTIAELFDYKMIISDRSNNKPLLELEDFIEYVRPFFGDEVINLWISFSIFIIPKISIDINIYCKIFSVRGSWREMKRRCLPNFLKNGTQ